MFWVREKFQKDTTPLEVVISLNINDSFEKIYGPFEKKDYAQYFIDSSPILTGSLGMEIE